MEQWPLFYQFILFGSIYLSINPTNPSKLFGGTWVQIKDGFLFATTATSGAAGSQGNLESGVARTQAATGNTGSTTLTVDQIPSHGHSVAIALNWGADGSARYKWTSAGATNVDPSDYSVWSNSLVARNTGGSQGHTHTLNSHKHLIPYTTVYMFKRTA